MPLNSLIELHKFNFTGSEVDTDGFAKTHWNPKVLPNGNLEETPEGTLELWAPTKGATTPGSKKTRSEFREVQEGVEDEFNWQIGQFDQFLKVTLLIEKVTPGGRVCIGQVHVIDNDRPPIKIVVDANTRKLRLMYRTTFNQPTDVGETLLANLDLSKAIAYSLHVTPGGTVSVSVSNNGVSATLAKQLDGSWAYRWLYFKAGIYNQDEATADTLEEYGTHAYLTRLLITRT